MKFYIIFDKTALLLAIEIENIEIVKQLLFNKPHINLVEKKSSKTYTNSLNLSQINKSNPFKINNDSTKTTSAMITKNPVQLTNKNATFEINQTKSAISDNQSKFKSNNALSPNALESRNQNIISSKSDKKALSSNFKIHTESFFVKSNPSFKSHIDDIKQKNISLNKNDDLRNPTTDILHKVSDSLSELRRARETYESLIEEEQINRCSQYEQQFLNQNQNAISMQQQQQQQQQWFRMIEMNNTMQNQFYMNMMNQQSQMNKHQSKKKKRNGK